jgi:putative transposase
MAIDGPICDPYWSATTKPNTDHDHLLSWRLRAELMKGSTAGALIPEIVRRGFQDLLKAEISALTGAHRLERCSDQGFTHRNVNRLRLLTTQMGDLTMPILRFRQGSFSPNWLELRRRRNA